MAFQAPLISIPRKTTSEVDWSAPIKAIIAHSYGEDASKYAEECSVLQRCRQDAVNGAGSDATARDLLYKYFGQLELLELRFAEIKVAFPWNDAFTLKSTTQTSMAFEKASIIYLLASVLSSLASSGSRADPEGVKRAYYHSRASAGMLTYINENFLHAPSTDLSRDVIHLLIGVVTAQATEIFTEKLVDEKKAPGLVSRSANSAAGMYNTLVDEMKEFQGKGIFDRNWLYILQIKAKLYASLAQYYRALADSSGGKHGHGLVRLKLADTVAQDASRQANNFNYTFVASSTPSLPHDAASSLFEITKAHATVCTEAKDQAVRDNDLIYHDILPSEASLPGVEKLPSAAPITIQEIYQNPEVSKLIGPDIFVRLVPLAVHESASVYSEEKAKLVRGEVERVDLSEGEIRASLDHLGLPGLVSSWRKLADDEDAGEADIDISSRLAQLSHEVQNGGSVDHLLGGLDRARDQYERTLRELSGQLDNESRECERMRAKYTPRFTQSPSGPQTGHFRSTITSNLDSLTAAASSDAHLSNLSREIQADLAVLSKGETHLRQTARQVASGKQPQTPSAGMSLLDLQDDEPAVTGSLDQREKEELGRAIADAQERLDRLGKIRRERDEVLRDFKEKIQTDDVSNLLLLNRRAQNVEPQLFAAELEKFRPYQGRLAAAVQASSSILQELEMLIRQVEKGKGVKERQRGSKDRQRRVREWERGLERAGEGYSEIQAGVGKGMSYYDSLGVVVRDIERQVRNWVRNREDERNRMVSEIETRQRISTSPPPLPSTSTGSRGLEAQLSGLSLDGGRYTSPPLPPAYPSPASSFPPPPAHPRTPSYAPLPPPPPQAQTSSPYNFGSNRLPSAFSTTASPPPASSQSYPAPPPRQESRAYPSYPAPSVPSSSSPYPSFPPPSTYPSHPPPSSSHYTAPSHSSSPYPPPPPRTSSTASYHSHTSPPPPQPAYPAYQPPGQQAYPPPSGPYHGQPGYAPPPRNQTQQYASYPFNPPPGRMS